MTDERRLENARLLGNLETAQKNTSEKVEIVCKHIEEMKTEVGSMTHILKGVMDLHEQRFKTIETAHQTATDRVGSLERSRLKMYLIFGGSGTGILATLYSGILKKLGFG